MLGWNVQEVAGTGVGSSGGVGSGVALHAAAHAACVCVPLASTVHVPVVSEQLNMGGGVGGGVGLDIIQASQEEQLMSE
jgi:hypothetical protein